MKTIVFPTDFSDGADRAAARVRELATITGARVHVLHVLSQGGMSALPPAWSARIRAERRREAEDTLQRVAGGLGPGATPELREGKAFVEIIRSAREQDAGLIVMGPHGGAGHIWSLGSTAERVARKGDRSVLVARSARPLRYARALVGIDFSEESRHAVQLARRLAPEARLALLHVYDDWFVEPMRRGGAGDAAVAAVEQELVQQAREDLRRLASEAVPAGHCELRVRPGYPGRTLLAEAEAFGADMVAVGATGAGAVPQLLFGSVAEHLLQQAEADVLIARGAPRPGFELP